MMTPAPRKPIPVIRPWMTRLVAAQSLSSFAAKSLAAMTTKAEASATTPSLDGLVGAHQERGGHLDAEGLCGLRHAPPSAFAEDRLRRGIQYTPRVQWKYRSLGG